MEPLLRFLFWVRIAISPILLFSIIALVVSLNVAPPYNKALAWILIIAGFVLGFLLAERARKKRGTIEFVSRVNASPDFDEIEKKGEKK